MSNSKVTRYFNVEWIKMRGPFCAVCFINFKCSMLYFSVQVTMVVEILVMSIAMFGIGIICLFLTKRLMEIPLLFNRFLQPIFPLDFNQVRSKFVCMLQVIIMLIQCTQYPCFKPFLEGSSHIEEVRNEDMWQRPKKKQMEWCNHASHTFSSIRFP